MEKDKKTFSYDDYTLSRVPLSDRANVLTISIIRIGGTTSLVQFMLGATLGHSMTFSQAMLATFLGGFFLEFISLGLGVIGAREGLSTSLLSRWCGFGYFGSALIGVAISISSLGWFGVQNSILAEGVVNAIGFEKNNALFFVTAATSGIFLSILVAFGFKGLSWIAKAALPLFLFVVGWIFVGILKDYNIYNLITTTPAGEPLSLGAAATAVAGGYIVFAIISPDMSRYCKNEKHVFWMMTSSIFIGEVVVNGISILIAHALNTSDVVTIMTHSAGWIGIFTVLLSAVKINDLNLYSSTLGMSNALTVLTGKKWTYSWLSLTLGIIGTSLSMTGILNHFVDFLVMLGVLFPPIAGVMLVDYYILRTHRELLDFTRSHGTLPDAASTPKIGWNAILAWIVGSVVGFTINFGIPSLNSLFAASFFYWILCKFLQKRD